MYYLDGRWRCQSLVYFGGPQDSSANVGAGRFGGGYGGQPTPHGSRASPAPQPARRLLPDERARAPRFVWRGALLR